MEDKQKNPVLKQTGKMLLLLAVSLFLSGCGVFLSETIDVEQHLDENVVHIKETTLTLEDLLFYIMRSEESVQKMALEYDKENPEAFWSKHINGKYMRTWAKEEAMEHAVRDELYAQKAKEMKLQLVKDYKTQVEKKASEVYSEMSEFQKERTHLTIEELEELFEKMMYANAYAEYMQGAYHISEEDLDVDGEYYQELKKTSEVEVNEKLWESVRLGDITIDNG